jgi:hypothetical protein
VADEDLALTVALAEYEAVREMRRGAHEGSAARFNYFLVVASGGTAVVAGLLGSGGLATARGAAAVAIGAMVLLVGGVVFVRLVHYRVTGLEYNTALDALRTYLVSRAPEVGPYVVMPTLADDVRLRMMEQPPTREHRPARQSASADRPTTRSACRRHSHSPWTALRRPYSSARSGGT